MAARKEQRPNGNGNQLRDWRLDKLEEIIVKHDERMVRLETAITAAASAGMTKTQMWALLGTFITVIGGIIVAIIQVAN